MTININNGASINQVLGHRTHHSCKPIINKTTGDVYASATDAAEILGCTIDAVSMCCRGKIKSCKGNELEYVKHASENVGSLTKVVRNKNAEIEKLRAKIAEMEADAAIGRAIREEKEAIRKAEEEYAKALSKARAKVERRQRVVENADAKLQLAVSRLMEAERELEALENAK